MMEALSDLALLIHQRIKTKTSVECVTVVSDLIQLAQLYDQLHREHHDGKIIEEQVEAQDEGWKEGEVRSEGERQAGEDAGFSREGGERETGGKRKGAYGAWTTGSWWGLHISNCHHKDNSNKFFNHLGANDEKTEGKDKDAMDTSSSKQAPKHSSKSLKSQYGNYPKWMSNRKIQKAKTKGKKLENKVNKRKKRNYL